ncbi:MAG: hypothetical protein OXG81_16615 [Acidobacteria bacterium]|nr:hypothetical protein [Acidobacteriota bacterium]MCY3963888.1 hypothetical protein [Acidobacteriota bacterium]
MASTSASDRGGALCVLVVAGVSLGCAEPVPEPNEKSLRASFIAQIESIDLVKDLEVYGSEIHFARPDGSGADVDWRVRIDSLEVGPWAGPEAELAGHVVSRWSVAGRPVSVEIGPDGLVTDMPFFVLDAGLAPECWAFWDEEAKAWGW